MLLGNAFWHCQLPDYSVCLWQQQTAKYAATFNTRNFGLMLLSTADLAASVIG